MESFYWAVQTTTTIGYGEQWNNLNLQVLFELFPNTHITYWLSNLLLHQVTLKHLTVLDGSCCSIWQ
jgi:hypothetical protein